ncbi:MAG TPA: hypothetical protein VNW90_15185 [Acetobacteraceae bacterium]|jgi:hypothetical protein|nr:hypothetical protein [Acetobacteraceae bacterium]
MAHVQIDGSGKVIGIFGLPQHGNAGVTEIPDNDPRIAAFLAPPSASASAILAQKIAAGIAITSTGTPALNATYALDPTTMEQIGSVARDNAASLGLPGGLPTFVYPDASGTPHTFTGSQIDAVYRAMRDLIFVLTTQAGVMAHGGSPVWPSQTAVIA